MTTIATWNLHHMGREKRIGEGVLSVIRRVRPDVLVLTEYVDRGGRTDFMAQLKQLRYQRPAVSRSGKGQNQVLVASREEHQEGPLVAPEVDDEAARTNFLHCRIPTLDLDIVGFRVPHYQSEKPLRPEKLEGYWRQLKKMTLAAASQKIVFIGDFNIGDKGIDEMGRRVVRHLVSKGFRLVGEVGGLDRALLSPKVKLQSFSVIETVGDCRLTGKGGLSDHAMLVVEVE